MPLWHFTAGQEKEESRGSSFVHHKISVTPRHPGGRLSVCVCMCVCLCVCAYASVCASVRDICLFLIASCVYIWLHTHIFYTNSMEEKVDTMSRAHLFLTSRMLKIGGMRKTIFLSDQLCIVMEICHILRFTVYMHAHAQ